MAVDIFATAGAQIYIGPAMSLKNTDFLITDFETSPALTYTQIGYVENLGSFGDAAQVVTANPIDHQRDIKLKGTRNAGNMALVTDIKEDDAGQLALVAAAATSSNYAFKVVFPNMPSGGTSGGKRYFIGMVMSDPEELAGANSVGKGNYSIEINSNIVRVSAV
jgi:hypothetical protein